MSTSEIFELGTLFKTAKYLVEVEDGINPAFFINGRPSFEDIIAFYRVVLKLMNQGYKKVKLTWEFEPKLNIYQPFYQYYLWEARLKSLVAITPIG